MVVTPVEAPIVERGLLSMPDHVWELARLRAEVIAPLAAMGSVGHRAADEAGQQLGLSRRQVYVLVDRYRKGSGLVTDLAPGFVSSLGLNGLGAALGHYAKNPGSIPWAGLSEAGVLRFGGKLLFWIGIGATVVDVGCTLLG